MTEGRLLSQKRLILTVKMWKALVAVVILFFSLVSALCPKHCHCPPKVPRCAAGVSLILDNCGCCKVCAQQLFGDCSKTQPCDHTKGLECNFGGGFAANGICRATSDGRTCEYNNKIYQNGEIFRPNCKHQCTCMDGAIKCVSLCPHKLSLAKMSCAKSKQVKIWVRCCEQLICPKDGLVVKKHNKDKASEHDLTFKSHAMGPMAARGVKCVSQTTAWSPCSTSCGTGVSTRRTNSKSQCKRVTETRICAVRPCDQRTFSRLKIHSKLSRS